MKQPLKKPPFFITIWLIILFCLIAWKIATGQDRKDLPELNKKIIKTAESYLGEKVGKGNCRHFVERVLKDNNADISLDNIIKERFIADWNSWDWQIDKVYPGDVIWIVDALVIDYKDERKRSYGLKEQIDNHIAIIYKVIGCDTFEIIEQNAKETLQYPVLSVFNLNTLDSGKIFIFRPHKSLRTSILWKTAHWVAKKRKRKTLK